jgi:unconventional prefoldin RPB5 interactor 1
VARVSESIADRRAELGRLQGFVADNAALVSLVNRLPDELSHEIMVFPSLPEI